MTRFPAWPPRATIAHDHIAGNLERMLNNRLERYAPSLLAMQRPKIELASGSYRPEPDVGIIDIGYEAGRRIVEKAYLLAEVSSEADEFVVPGTDRKWIDVKREIYRSHGHCEAVLVVAQDRMEVEMNLKTETGWEASILSGGEAEITIPAFGFWCLVGDLYEGTPLLPRPISERSS
jgi:putative restriction endonuclease